MTKSSPRHTASKRSRLPAPQQFVPESSGGVPDSSMLPSSLTVPHMSQKPVKTSEKPTNSGETNQRPLGRFAKAAPTAERCGVCPKTIHRWALSGLIHAHKINARTVLFDLHEVEAFIEKCRTA
jgi:hypothetical protein